MIAGGRAGESERASAVLPALVLAALAFLVFGGVAGHEFVAWDTASYLTGNPRVLGGLSPESLRWAFWHAHAGNWHPLTWWSHMLDVELFGLDPRGHHLENVGWHAANAVLLFLFLRRTTGRGGASFAAALLFALHPQRAESVAWIVERKDVLSTFLGLLALHAYAAWTARGGALPYLAACAALALGLMAKPMLVTWPFVLLLLDVWPLARAGVGWTRRLVEKLPFLALSLGAALLTLAAQRSGGAVRSLEDLPLAARIGHALVAYVEYLRQTLLPVDLAFHYPHPGPRPIGLVAGAGLLLAAISALAWRARRAAPELLVGWSWFLLTLVPVLGIVQVGGQARADRYTYVPSIGLAFAACWLAARVLERASRWIPRAAAASAAGLLALLCVRQVATWRSTETLARRALAVTGKNHVAHDLLGVHLLGAGELEAGVQELQRALAIAPGDVDALDNLGVAFAKLGRPADGEAVARRSIALAPGRASAHVSLGAALRIQARFEEARDAFERALELEPAHVGAWTNLGLVLEQLGRGDDAIEAFGRALSLRPDHAPARLSLARVFVRRGDLERAGRELESVLEGDPLEGEALRGLARIELARGRDAAARALLERALAGRPPWPAAQADLAWLLATSSDAATRDPGRALELALEATRAGGDSQPPALDALGAAYAAAGRFPEAVAAANAALSVARELGDVALSARIEGRIEGYRDGRPAGGER